MRRLLLAGVATVTFGLAAAPAMADPFYFCIWEGLTSGTTQVQCAKNTVEDPPHWWQSNDDNKQVIKQDQDALLQYNPGYTVQLQIGLNKVEEGDDNTQIIKQHQDIEDWNSSVGYSGTEQLQVGVNTVEDGDDNTQVIKQSQSLQYGCGSCDAQ